MTYREKMDEEIQRMLEAGFMRRSGSPYINPVVTVRLCLYARKLNEILEDDWECLQPAEVLF